MNEDENAVVIPETPSPGVPASGDGQHKTGSATKPRSKKRHKDKDRSVAALEAVMSRRLAEQVFDMCFKTRPRGFSVDA
jgi:hypothetical protein